jgi:hypothetical protein
VPNRTRELAELIQVLLDAVKKLTDMLVNQLPPDLPEPIPLTASVHGVTGNQMTADLHWDNSGTGRHVRIDWGVTDATDDDEPATGSKTYQYELEGSYVIMVTDHDDPTRVATVDVTVPIVTGT